jgi:hypothetical protein
MSLAPIIAAIKGTIDYATLPKRVENAQRKLAIPILENPENKIQNRFVFVRSILEASLLERLEAATTNEQKLLLKETHFQRMRKELEMNKKNLEKQPATRADVAVLGLALQEVALCLDEHVTLFKKSGQTELEAFQKKSADAIHTLRVEMDKFIHEKQCLQQQVQAIRQEYLIFKRNMLIGAGIALVGIVCGFVLLR